MNRNNLFPLPQAAEVRPVNDFSSRVARAKAASEAVDACSGESVERAADLGKILEEDKQVMLNQHAYGKYLKAAGISRTKAYRAEIIHKNRVKCFQWKHLGVHGVVDFIRTGKTGEEDEDEPKDAGEEQGSAANAEEEAGDSDESEGDEDSAEPETSSEDTSPQQPEEADPDYITLEAWQRLTVAQRRKVIAEAAGDKKFNSQGDNENIEWALWSWNPVTGCLHNCPYCYARDIATTGPTAHAFPNGFAPTLIPSRLKAPHNTTFPESKARDWIGHKNVFVCSMADLFGRWVPAEWIEAVLAEVRAAPQWNFLFLTKFPIRMAEFSFPDNAWVGTTVDCQARVANAEKAFRKVKAGVKWLSIEPMIEPLQFSDLGAFQWIVIGGSSRSSQTPEWHPPRKWVWEIEKEAKKLGVSFYEKSNLHGRLRGYPGQPVYAEPNEAPEPLRYLPTDKG